MRRWLALLLLTLLLPFTSAAVAACVHEAVVIEATAAGHHAHSVHVADADAPGAHTADSGDCHAGCGACVPPHAVALPCAHRAPCPALPTSANASLAAPPPDRPQWLPRPVRG